MRIRIGKLSWWVASMLPDTLKYLCFNLVAGHATTGDYSNQSVPDLLVVDASKRFYDDRVKGTRFLT